MTLRPPAGFPDPTFDRDRWSRSGSCPCGAGAPYVACCGPLLDDDVLADTPVVLMRSRFSATCLGHGDYLWRTWHPATRPRAVAAEPLAAGGLRIADTTADEVAFVASLWDSAGTFTGLTERSRFEFRGGRWLYRDGDVRWAES